MKRILFLCGLMAFGGAYTASAQADDRYATDYPSETPKRTIEASEGSSRQERSTTSYLSYEDDVSYSSRIKRFHRPMVSVGYWSGMYDPFWDIMYVGSPSMMYSPWGIGWGMSSWYNPYRPWGWGGYPYWGSGISFGWGGFGYGMGWGYGWSNPYRYWGWGGGYGWGYENPGYRRHANRNTRGLNAGPRRTSTVGERRAINSSSSNIRYDNGTRTRSIDGNRGNVRQNSRGVDGRGRNNSIAPRGNDRVAPRNNNRGDRVITPSQPSRMNSQPRMNTQPSRSTPSRNFSPSSSPSRGSGFSSPSPSRGGGGGAPSRGGGRGR